MELSDGFIAEEIETSEAYDVFVRNQDGFESGFVRIQPGGSVLPRSYVSHHARIRGLEVHEDDIWISSFPKCGTTWTQEMVWNIMNNVDLETARSLSLEDRVPFLELSAITEDSLKKKADEEEKISGSGLFDTIAQVERLERPRIIKTHLCKEMLPSEVLKRSKLIYVARNPRDAVLSFHNHWKILDGYRGDFAGFLNAFLNDTCGYYTPFIQHVLGYWNIRHEKNVLFIFFEEMKADLPSVIRRVAKFLDKELTPEQITALTGHLDFKSMRANPAVNKADVVKAIQAARDDSNRDRPTEEVKAEAGVTGEGEGRFMRSGKTGGWKDRLTEDQLARMKEWELRNLAGSDLKFTYSM